MTLADEIRARNTTTLDAAKELGRGLMRGDKEELKLGYSYENAARAAEGMFDVPKIDALELRCYLLGFGMGLNKTGDDNQTDEMVRQLGTKSEHYYEAFFKGHDAGWAEADANAYPASVGA